MAVPRNAVGRFGPGGRGVSLTDVFVTISVIVGLTFVTYRIMNMEPVTIWGQPEVTPAMTADPPVPASIPPPVESTVTESR